MSLISSQILIETGTRLLEPIMNLEIVVSANKLSAILADLSRKRAIIGDILHKGQNKVIFQYQCFDVNTFLRETIFLSLFPLGDNSQGSTCRIE